MAVDAATPTTITSAPATNSGSSSTNNTSSTATTGIADNFQTFLTLLTTQLQNQNPLDPLDTNQFTQQLVQFAGVEQQLKSNDQLKSLADLCRQHRRRRRQQRAVRHVGDLEHHSSKGYERHDHDIEFDGAGSLYREFCLEPGQCQFRLGRQEQ